MEKTDGDGTKVKINRGPAKKWEWTLSSLPNLIRFPAPLAMIDGIIVLPLSRSLSILLPPLFVSSLPKRAIGFSFPRGTEGKFLGVSLIGATVAISVLLSTAFGFIFGLAIIWIMGGT